MRILVDLCHPAHVHFFKYAINHWLNQGHKIKLTVRDKDITVKLLDQLNLNYQILTKIGQKSTLRFISEFAQREWKLIGVIRKFKPDVVTAIGGAFIAPACKFAMVPSIVFTDTEHVIIDRIFTYPLAYNVCTPYCFKRSAGSHHIRYHGLHELAYLHPDRFKPDLKIVKKFGIDPDKKYCILRFVSWQAHHDIGQQGFDQHLKSNFVKEISKYAIPYITSEEPLPPELESYHLKIPYHQIHHIMAFASLCIGEGATMASESAILGVPAVYINTLKLGYIDMLTEFGLVKQATNTMHALDQCINLLTCSKTKQNCKSARQKMLSDKIDVTNYIIKTIEAFAENGDRNRIKR